jgi:hypothetical protein
MSGVLGRVGFLALVLAFLAGASYVYDRIANVNDRNDAQGTLDEFPLFEKLNLSVSFFDHGSPPQTMLG